MVARFTLSPCRQTGIFLRRADGMPMRARLGRVSISFISTIRQAVCWRSGWGRCPTSCLTSPFRRTEDGWRLGWDHPAFGYGAAKPVLRVCPGQIQSTKPVFMALASTVEADWHRSALTDACGFTRRSKLQRLKLGCLELGELLMAIGQLGLRFHPMDHTSQSCMPTVPQ